MSIFRFDANGRCFVNGRTRAYPWARVLVEGHLQRELQPEEIVHHLNGDPTDDRIENLQIVTAREHMTLHRADLGKAMRKGRVTLVCPVCLLTFERLESKIGTYCSRKCQHEAQRVMQCRHGHPRTPENTHVRSNGRTECLVCLRERSRRIRRRQRVTA